MKKKEANFIKNLLLLIIMIGSTNSFSQPTKSYSLDECIQLALENNEQVKNSKLDVQSSEYKVKEAKGAFLPAINLNGQYQYYMELPSQYVPASAFGGPEGHYSKTTMNLAQTTSANIQSTQLLFNQPAIWGLKSAKIGSEVSQLRESLTQEDMVYNVTATYYTIQVLQDNLVRLRENIENLEKTVKINETLKSNELVSANVHNRLLINLENLRNQYEIQKLSYDKNLTFLKYLMNIRIGEDFLVEAFNYEETLDPPAGMDVNHRSDIKLQHLQIKLSEYEKKNTVAAYYPMLMGSMSLGYTGYYDEFSPGKQLNNDWIRGNSFSLTLKMPVFDGFQKQNKIKQKEITVQKNINTLSMMKANAEREMQDAANNYSINANQLINTRKSLELAEQLFVNSQSEFENGITSTTELLNAQNDLSNARTNFSNALLNLKLAELSWKKASGTLLQEHSSKKN